jgi:hypothetical protein
VPTITSAAIFVTYRLHSLGEQLATLGVETGRLSFSICLYLDASGSWC